ncbi:hypothetical protein HNY73_009187 [Argiope bruennichi]|uniref:Uncharacterized protein n=1 Tax=Argiope bruennichi TaxID=94029 RepID=A0A8T0F8S6_ARGBR|nr:hypothetical protein HNY73_009187 [Argiope bruennichi]
MLSATTVLITAPKEDGEDVGSRFVLQKQKKDPTPSPTSTEGANESVNYITGGYGFQAVVKTNEPGTKASTPTAVIV